MSSPFNEVTVENRAPTCFLGLGYVQSRGPDTAAAENATIWSAWSQLQTCKEQIGRLSPPSS